MSDIGELVSFAMLDDDVGECPFEAKPIQVDPAEGENVANDDTKGVWIQQDNDGGTLGKNVENGSPGVGGSWNDVGGNPPVYQSPRVDTRRTHHPTKTRVLVDGDQTPRPFTVAAHHLVPGNAALYDSKLFKQYMEEGGKVTLKVLSGAEKTFELDAHIGYNVNGSHNGVWLPGSYAIRSGASPNGESWGVLNDPKEPKCMLDWCQKYMATVARVAAGQFHDTHVGYSDKVLEAIDKTAAKLSVHQQGCPKCEGKTKIPPPYSVVKPRLYRTSSYLRDKTLTLPQAWQRPWFTSDQVSRFWGDGGKRQAFLDAYQKGKADVR